MSKQAEAGMDLMHALSPGRSTQHQPMEDRTMPKIEILGPGCQKCRLLYERTKQAAEELGLECEIEKVTDVEALINYGVMSTPAVVVDGRVKLYGRVPSVPQLKEILS